MSGDIEALQKALRQFSEERDWGQFHSPKNLAAALSVESAELLEHFQWLTEEQSRSLDNAKLSMVGEEIADVLLYLIQLSDRLQINLLDVAWSKLEANGRKYPVDRAKGTMKKYNEL